MARYMQAHQSQQGTQQVARFHGILRIVALLLFGSTLLNASAVSRQDTTASNLSIELKQVQNEISQLSRHLDAVHRDQLNYKIEKDLLKEAYSSNLERVNLIITIVLGVFGVLGFLGLKSIREIHQEYSAELNQIRTLKGSFENELAGLRSKQREFESEVAKLATESDDQDRRLKLLEIIEKVHTLFKDRALPWALEHISVGLAIDPDNAILLAIQAQCYGKLGRVDNAIATSKRLLAIEPDNESNATNLLEFLALKGEETEFAQLYEQHKSHVNTRSNGALAVYLRALIAATTNQIHSAKQILSSFASAQPPEPNERLGGWSFDDVIAAVNPMTDGAQKRFLFALIGYFNGELDGPTLSTRLDALTIQ
jgi:tetratricopeptide (TPR) repeat protein